MTTDRERIIAFLTEHPEWVDAYRLTNPDGWVGLGWLDERPLAVNIYDAERVARLHESGGAHPHDFTLPPEGEWRPLPAPETFEVNMVGCHLTAVGTNAYGGEFDRFVRADTRFTGHRVRVTVEAIG